MLMTPNYSYYENRLKEESDKENAALTQALVLLGLFGLVFFN